MSTRTHEERLREMARDELQYRLLTSERTSACDAGATALAITREIAESDPIFIDQEEGTYFSVSITISALVQLAEPLWNTKVIAYGCAVLSCTQDARRSER